MTNYDYYNTDYVAHCAGIPVQDRWGAPLFRDKKIDEEAARLEFARRLAAEQGIRLAVLRTAEDFEEQNRETETYYDGPDGPFQRTLTTAVVAFGAEWYRVDEVIDRARDVTATHWRRIRL